MSLLTTLISLITTVSDDLQAIADAQIDPATIGDPETDFTTVYTTSKN
jgi:hypothetical protein